MKGEVFWIWRIALQCLHFSKIMIRLQFWDFKNSNKIVHVLFKLNMNETWDSFCLFFKSFEIVFKKNVFFFIYLSHFSKQEWFFEFFINWVSVPIKIKLKVDVFDILRVFHFLIFFFTFSIYPLKETLTYQLYSAAI